MCVSAVYSFIKTLMNYLVCGVVFRGHNVGFYVYGH